MTPGSNFPYDHSVKSIWSMGFGAVNTNTLVSWGDSGYAPRQTLITSTLLANTPQLILSLLYFTYNGIFTYELIGREWSKFGQGRRALRVTSPRGQQRSTYWLNLPYRYGIPLAAVAVLLHWLFSRAIFPVNIRFDDPVKKSLNGGTGEYDTILPTIQCGWSPSAVIVSIIAAGLVVIVGVLFGFRRYAPGGPQLVGSCSAAIAAACHRDPDEDGEHMVLLPLRWGVTSSREEKEEDVLGTAVRTGMGTRTGVGVGVEGRGGVVVIVGHCTFSAREVETPNEEDYYQ